MSRRTRYEPPHLVPLTYSAISKHLTFDVSSEGAFEETIESAALLREFGSPLFVVSERQLRRQYRAFLETFSEAGIQTRVAYSYKTNYLSAIVAIMHQEGAWAEVVSGMEFEHAEKLGMAGSQIIFNGPYKRREEIERALSKGATINVDSFDEFALIEQVVGALDRPTKLGIRVNFRHGSNPWNKFGFNFENGDAEQLLKRIAENPNLDLDLVHNHSGTYLLQHDIYGRSTEVLIQVARRARELGLSPTKIDVGGGFPSGNRLKPAFDFPGGTNWRGDMLFPYAEAICGRLAKAKDVFGGSPTLVLEPGRALVDSAVQLLATVVSVKTIPGQGRAVVIDAGVNLIPTAYWYDHNIKPTDAGPEADSSLEPVSIYGPLCMQIDVVRERAMLPPVKYGDAIVIGNVGAYCHTQSMQFIQTRPATVLLGPNGPEIIQRRETWADVFARDTVPDRLRQHGS